MCTSSRSPWVPRLSRTAYSSRLQRRDGEGDHDIDLRLCRGRRQESAVYLRRRRRRCRCPPGGHAGDQSARTWSSASTRSRWPLVLTPATSAPTAYPILPSLGLSARASRPASAPTPTWTALTTTLAVIVDQEIECLGVAGDDDCGGLGRVEGQADAAGEVVAGAERNQPDHAPRASSPASCSEATTACRLPSPPATTISRPSLAASTEAELVSAGGRLDVDVDSRARAARRAPARRTARHCCRHLRS